MIFDIIRNSFVDGPGIRTTVFFKGCNLRCAWCHNPESQSAQKQMMVYSSKCIGCGKCKAVCPHSLEQCDFCGKCALFCPADARKICGEERSAEELMAELLKDQAFYENSGGGVTFSGGECMLQIELLEELLRQCKQKGIHTAVDTAGHVPFAYFERILPYTDLFLYDVKAMDPQTHQKYVGVDNALILENLAKLLKGGANLWVRVPIIPSVNDTPAEMAGLKAFFQANGAPQKIELLPYHAMGEHKYRALGQAPQPFQPPSAEQLEQLKKLL